jgi:hypothetical protein
MLRVTIRDLLLITLSIALALGWYIDHMTSRVARAKNGMLRNALQSTLDDYESQTGRPLGIQLPDGEFFHSRRHQGLILEGSS